MKLHRVVLVALACLVGACDGDEVPPLGAPTITMLTLTTTSVPIEVAANLVGTVTYMDREGDPVEVAGKVTGPNGEQVVVNGPVTGTIAGLTTGTASFDLSVKIPTAGTWTLRLQLLDSGRRFSNALEATFQAQ